MFFVNLQSSIKQFLDYLRCEKGYCENTIKSYAQDLNRLQKLAEKIAPKNLQELFSSLKLIEDPRSSSSYARWVCCLKSFLSFLYKEKQEVDLRSLLTIPKVKQVIPKTLTLKQVDLLLEAPDVSDFVGARDKAMLHVLYSTGIRVSELCGLDLKDVDDDAIKVKGKGGKERIVPMTEKAIRCIDFYLLRFRDFYLTHEKSALFVSKKGKRLDRNLAWKRIKLYCQGLKIQASPHVLRHCFATHLLQNHADLRVIQELMGHESIATTQRYTQVADETIQRAFDQFHPR